jgi:hypothetical protein
MRRLTCVANNKTSGSIYWDCEFATEFMIGRLLRPILIQERKGSRKSWLLYLLVDARHTRSIADKKVQECDATSTIFVRPPIADKDLYINLLMKQQKHIRTARRSSL